MSYGIPSATSNGGKLNELFEIKEDDFTSAGASSKDTISQIDLLAAKPPTAHKCTCLRISLEACQLMPAWEPVRLRGRGGASNCQGALPCRALGIHTSLQHPPLARAPMLQKNNN